MALSPDRACILIVGAGSSWSVQLLFVLTAQKALLHGKLDSAAAGCALQGVQEDHLLKESAN